MASTRRRLFIGTAVGLLLVGVSVFYAWKALFTSHSLVKSSSPDGRHTTIVSSTFGLSTNQFDIKVVDNNSHLIIHLAVTDKHSGWATDPSIQWETDSKMATVGLEDPDAGVSIKRIEIDMP